MRVTHGALLVLLWLLAWGEISIANLLSGTVLAAVLLVVFPPRRPGGEGVRVRPLGFLRLALHVARSLPLANLLVAREILSPRRQARTGVIAHRVATPNDSLLSLIANVIALSPGTMTVEVTLDPAVIYVHFLVIGDVDHTRRAIADLEDRCRAALRLVPSDARPATSEGAS